MCCCKQVGRADRIIIFIACIEQACGAAGFIVPEYFPNAIPAAIAVVLIF
jgi:hypothetical protein